MAHLLVFLIESFCRFMCSHIGQRSCKQTEPPEIVDPGASRTVKFFGQSESHDRFVPLAKDAGNLVPIMPADCFPVPIPTETLETDTPEIRWCYFLFDLAWARIPGSPLRPSKDKMAWYGHTSITLASFPQARIRLKPIADRFPDQPHWFSVIDDIVQASLYATDILLLAKKPSEEADQRPRKGDRKPRKPRTRKKRSDPKSDKRIAEAYRTGRHRTEAQCAKVLGITEMEVHQARDRHRKRETAKKRARNRPRQ